MNYRYYLTPKRIFLTLVLTFAVVGFACMMAAIWISSPDLSTKLGSTAACLLVPAFIGGFGYFLAEEL